jgi:hypothetical protein
MISTGICLESLLLYFLHLGMSKLITDLSTAHICICMYWQRVSLFFISLKWCLSLPSVGIPAAVTAW